MTKHDGLDAYLLDKMGAEKDYKIEWEWFRYLVGGKMFAATLQPSATHKEYAGLNLVSLKCDPVWAERLRADYPEAILPGFYMNKRTWNSVNLDGNVPEDLLRQMCDHSYDLVFGTLTKKLQREITETNG